jgi:signal transduction histidine kinase
VTSPASPAAWTIAKAPPRRLRNRILVAMVAVAIGVLVFTGVVTVALTRRAAVDAAAAQLRDRAPAVSESLERLRTRLDTQQAQQRSERGDLRVRREFAAFVRAALQISDGTLVAVTPDGTVGTGSEVVTGTGGGAVADGSPILDLPPGVTAADLDPEALQAGETQSGTDGDTVFVAVPLRAEPDGTIPVVVLSNTVERGLAGRAGPFFLFTAFVAAAAATVVSYFLARRFTRPLAVMGDTAGRIAAGDLSARVDLGTHPTDELGALAGTLNDMAAQLDEARGQERAFLLSVSHDLRTPLTSIRGYAEAMTDGTADDAEARQRAAAVIASESRRLERLVADLLQLASLDARQFSLRPRPLDAVATIRDALDAFQPGAEELGVSLQLDAPDRIPAEADPERLGQIIANLVENALKYARTSVRVTVASTTRAGPAALEVEVADDGPGIDPTELAAVFERLYTARGAPARAVGTGLGLAIVRELVAAMGGQVSAASGPGGGATFTVRLPVVAPAGPTSPS